MNITIDSSWQAQLKDTLHQSYFLELMAFVKKEYAQYTCYPRREDIFSAFDHCSFEETKVVIIGQDPYHGPGQANGLCFSVKEGISHPPSLINIFKEIEKDLEIPYPSSGNLERWAKQGVLLLNATLTVREHKAGSHQKKGWEIFTDTVIQQLSKEKTGIIFLLWGGFAKQKIKLIDTTKHHVLTSGHPSPLSANRGFWYGNTHFSQCNALLKKESVNW